jgi:glycosyltransferase involved in cell wall biosynthesis
MTEQPLVSVIIPCYNHGNYIQETIDSILQQSYKNIEIIIIDDGSDDIHTLEVLNSFHDSKISFLHQKNGGPSIARNNGLKTASGKYFVPLDADDLICEDTIEYAVNIMELKMDIGVVYGNCQYFGEKQKLRKQDPLNITTLIKDNTIALCSVIRTKAFLQSGAFDEFLSTKGLEDWDLWLMLFEKGWKFHYVNKTLFNIRVLFISRTTQIANKNLDEIKSYVYKKHSDLLVKVLESQYHENKNLRNTLDYRIGNFILQPLRNIKLFIKRGDKN